MSCVGFYKTESPPKRTFRWWAQANIRQILSVWETPSPFDVEILAALHIRENALARLLVLEWDIQTNRARCGDDVGQHYGKQDVFHHFLRWNSSTKTAI
jgi:hypothetical protein